MAYIRTTIFFILFLHLGYVITQAAPHSSVRQRRIETLALELWRADLIYFHHSGPTREHEVIGCLVSVAHEPDLTVLREACKLYIRKNKDRNDLNAPMLDLLLPLVFQPNQDKNAGGTYPVNWWPLKMKDKKLYIDDLLVTSGVHDFFRSFDFFRGMSLPRTNLEIYSY